MDRQNYKLEPNEKFISSKLLENLITETDINKAIVEEINSELWFETLNGYGKVKFKNNVEYTGNLHYGILESESPDKPSTIIFPNKTTYTGTMKQNQITGSGEYTFPNGSKYIGEVLNGLRHGYGKFTSENGIIYEGEWKKGLKHGKGKIIQGNMCLEGTWKDGVIDGPGRIKWKSGNIYEGELAGNEIFGQGYMIWYNNNEKFTGQWKKNLQNGYGIHIWYEPRGEQKYLRDRYVGEWLNGTRNGYGRFYYSNGSIYEGYWVNNKKEGFGVLVYPDRKKYIGNFKEDRVVDNNTLIMLMNKKNNQKEESQATTQKQLTTGRKQSRKGTFKSGNLNVSSTNNQGGNTSSLQIISENDKSSIKKTPVVQTSNVKSNDIKKSTIRLAPDSSNNDSIVKAQNTSFLKHKIEQSLNEIKLQIDISDLMDMEPDIKKTTLKELDNLLLRNLSFITHMYLYACGKETIKEADLATSTISPSVTNETKTAFNNQLVTNKNEEEKKESIIEYDTIYNNDLYFCLDFQGFWKFCREAGILSSEITLASIDRLYFQNSENYIEMFYIPEEYISNKGEKVYDYLLKSIDKSKKKFNDKYRAQIDQFNILVGNVKENKEEEEEKVNEKEISFEYEIGSCNYHEGKNIIMLRYFYELLIRLAYLKYSAASNLSLDQKVKNLFTYLKQFFKAKKKSLDTSLATISVLDVKFNRNWESSLDQYINAYQIPLLSLFTKMYKNYVRDNSLFEKLNDMTITYNYIYYNIILKNDKLSQIVKEKTMFIELITIYHKDKIIQSNPISGSSPSIEENNPDIISYMETVLNNEFIFFEFCELLFILSKRYFGVYGIKNENYQDIIDLLNQTLDENQKKRNEINNYTFPKLKAHIQIEKMKQEEIERKLEEERKAKEQERFEKERKNFSEEDINIYKEEEKSKSDSFSDYN